MDEVLNKLLKRSLPFKVRGSNAGKGVKLFYEIKNGDDETLFTIKEYYDSEGVPHFDSIDFSNDENIEICNLSLQEITSKIMTFPIKKIYGK